MQAGLVFHIQRYSIHDGPGIRTTVFLKGCPLDCWWCHNPESRLPEPEVFVIETRCIRCGQCVDVCPQRARGNGTATAEAGQWCLRCGACVRACPTGAREMVGRRMTVAEVLAEILKDRVFYDDSGGGATFSGGEPLMQPEFLKGLLEACRQEGVNTALDTCGFAPQADLLELAPLVDLFLYDLKLVDPAAHARYTGVSSERILHNLRALGAVHENIWIRVPLIRGINDDPQQMQAMARFAATIPGVRQVNLLPYHQSGIAKARRLGVPYRLEQAAPPSAEELHRAAACFSDAGLATKIGG